ncbi:MAG TPA: UDP-3-O-(3-hydroxymyristoyl)glucosamine N-acyltransferase [Polyangiaceae bacterium]|jgi:UDP-3-O-[3-hydroxymyristoyl] glucosamine N-acyltransferase
MGKIALLEPRPLSELQARYGGALDPQMVDAVIERVITPEQASDPSDLVVVTSSRVLPRVESAQGILLCSEEMAHRVHTRRRWIHSHPMWVVAELLAPLERSASPVSAARSGSAVTHAQIAPDVEIGPGAVIFSGAVIGAGCRIGPNAVIYPSVRLAERVIVGAGAVIGAPGFGWTRGPENQLRRIPQLGGVEVMADVEIGALCTIASGTLGPTRIGVGVKLDAQIHVGHNAEIGEGTMVAAQSGFAGSSRIGPEVHIGGQVGIADHVQVGEGARIAAKSGVIGDVPAHATVAGYPALPRMRWLRAMARLVRSAAQSHPS